MILLLPPWRNYYYSKERSPRRSSTLSGRQSYLERKARLSMLSRTPKPLGHNWRCKRSIHSSQADSKAQAVALAGLGCVNLGPYVRAGEGKACHISLFEGIDHARDCSWRAAGSIVTNTPLSVVEACTVEWKGHFPQTMKSLSLHAAQQGASSVRVYLIIQGNVQAFNISHCQSERPPPPTKWPWSPRR